MSSTGSYYDTFILVKNREGDFSLWVAPWFVFGRFENKTMQYINIT